MEKQENQNATKSKNEKIWLAVIPVIGAIIIAIIGNSKCDRNIENKKKTDIINLKKKAGKVSEIAVFNNYNDLLPLLSNATKPFLTRELFEIGNDSIKAHLGNFIKPIDTTKNSIDGKIYYYVKNQYELGQNIMIISFDEDNNVLNLTYRELPK